MAELKTKPQKTDVKKFLNKIEDEQKRKDALTLLNLFETITKKKAVLWGTSIIGFDQYHYVYASGREGDWPITGFSMRKQNISIYIMTGFSEYKDLLEKLGKHKTGSSCLYIKNLESIHLPTLKKMITKSVTAMRKKYH